MAAVEFVAWPKPGPTRVVAVLDAEYVLGVQVGEDLVVVWLLVEFDPGVDDDGVGFRSEFGPYVVEGGGRVDQFEVAQESIGVGVGELVDAKSGRCFAQRKPDLDDRTELTLSGACGVEEFGLVRRGAPDAGAVAGYDFERGHVLGDGAVSVRRGADAAGGDGAPDRDRVAVGQDRGEEPGAVEGVDDLVPAGAGFALEGRSLRRVYPVESRDVEEDRVLGKALPVLGVSCPAYDDAERSAPGFVRDRGHGVEFVRLRDGGGEPRDHVAEVVEVADPYGAAGVEAWPVRRGAVLGRSGVGGGPWPACGPGGFPSEDPADGELPRNPCFAENPRPDGVARLAGCVVLVRFSQELVGHREHVLAEVFKFDDVKAGLFDEALVRFEALEAPERPVLADGVDVLDVLGGCHRVDPHPVVHGQVPARPQGARYLCEEFAAALVVAGVLDVDHDVDAPGVDGPGFGDVGDSVFDSGCLARRCGRGFLLGKRNLARRAIEAEHVAAVLAREEAGGASDSAPSVDDEVVGLDPGWGGDDLDEPVECSRESGPVDAFARCCCVGCPPVPEVDVLVVVVLVEVFRVRGVMVDDARVVVVLGICTAGPAGGIRFGAFCGSGVGSIHGQGVRSEQGVLLHGSTESRGGGSRNLLGAFGAREILGGIREGALGVVGGTRSSGRCRSVLWAARL